MAGSIGTLVLKLGVVSDSFERKLDRSARTAERAGRAITRALTIPQRLVSQQLNLPLLSGALGGLREAVGGVPFVGGALSALLGGGAGFLGNVQEQMDAVLDLNRQAQRLGVTTETLAGVQLLAGGASEAMERGMFHLAHELGQAALGGKEAGAKFAALGLDAKELSAVPLDEALGKISDRIRSLPTGVEQATAAYELFGRRGEEMLPVLLKGSQALEQAKQRARELGLAVSQVDAANVARASLAVRNIQGTVAGVFRQAAVGLAPYIEAVGGWLNRVVHEAGGVGPAVGKAFEKVGQVIADVLDEAGELLDALKEIKGAFSGLSTSRGKLEAFNSIVSPTANLRRGKDFLAGLFEEEKPGARTGKLGDALRRRLDEARSAFSAVKPAEAGPGLAQFQLGADVGEFRDRLREEIATLGMGKDAVKLYEFSQRGATAAQLDSARALVEERDRLEALNRAYHEGRGVAEGYAAALEARQRKLLGLGAEADVGAAVRDLENKANAAAKDMVEKAGPLGGMGFAAEVILGADPGNKALQEKIRAYKEAVRVFEQYAAQLKALGVAEGDVAAQRAKALLDKGVEVKVKGRSELDKLAGSLEDLAALVTEIDDATGKRKFDFFGEKDYAQGVLSALEEAERGLGLGREARLAPAAAFGTAEGAGVVNRFQAQMTQPQDTAGRLEAVRREAQAIKENQDRLLKDILAELRKGNPIKVKRD